MQLFFLKIRRDMYKSKSLKYKLSLHNTRLHWLDNIEHSFHFETKSDPHCRFASTLLNNQHRKSAFAKSYVQEELVRTQPMN